MIHPAPREAAQQERRTEAEQRQRGRLGDRGDGDTLGAAFRHAAVEHVPEGDLTKPVRPDRIESNRFRNYVRTNAKKLHGLPVAEAVRRSGCAIAEITGRQILRALGVRPFRPASVLARVNWRLPNATLCQVWNLAPTYVAAMRWGRGEPKPKWDSRSKATYTDPAYLRALAAERKKADAARAEAAEVRSRKNGAKRVKQWTPSRTKVPQRRDAALPNRLG